MPNSDAPQPPAVHPEALEKARQAIMRYRELLDLMQSRLRDYERAYVGLFAGLSESAASLPEKGRQREAAYAVLDDDKALTRALLTARFDSRDFEREFEALHDRVVELRTESDLWDS
ncbi:MAG: hypothetical protein L6Q98_08835 [Anaerolineae bacterium]|nr:hypothetical protein [Anaerolineae bacterium]NUQ05046.1 hypothetical protein [Anaerolineae bacterium]